MPSPSNLHQQAAQLRESGQSLEALALYEKALIAYLQESELSLRINVLLEKNIVLKHLWHQTPLPEYLDLAENNLDVALQWADQHQADVEQQALLFFSAADISLLRTDFSDAINLYQKALKTLPQNHAFSGQFLYHLGFAQALDDQEIGLQNLLLGKNRIEKQNNLESYTKEVWLSGAWLRIALIYLKGGKIAQAQSALDQATTIIEQNDQLSLRKQDLARVKNLVESGHFSLEEAL